MQLFTSVKGICAFIWDLINVFFHMTIMHKLIFFFFQNFGAKFIANFLQLIHATKWKYGYIICRKKEKMNKNVDNRFVPNYVPNNLSWHERDG